ncbi:MAG: type III secretion system translocon subunit SctE [Plesiomonas sp.]|uniref:type III secretion system translocon subunit SctE n=2 Tax=Plesiomonas sp. TaxID=2486279 RepID=UPI003F2DABE6
MNQITGAGVRPTLDLASLLQGGGQVSGNFVKAAQTSAEALFALRAAQEEGVAKSDGGLARPSLTPPTPQAEQTLNNGGQLTLLLGQLLGLLGDASLNQFASRIAVWQAMMASQVAMGEQLSSELKEAIAEATAANEAYEQALGELGTANTALDAAKSKLADAKAKLAQLSPDDPGYANALAEYQQAEAEVASAQTRVNQAEQKAKAAHANAAEKVSKTDALLSQTQTLSSTNQSLSQQQESHLSNVAQLTMLMAMFVELVGKSSEDSLKNDMALFQTMQESRQAEMEKKSVEYQEEVRKAEELNRTMGCIGKILGGLLAVVSLAAAAFTGGASLAIAAVGFALMTADQVVKAATGVSFMEEALKPLMDNILKPLMDMIGKAISSALQSFGVDKQQADMIGSILGAVLAAIAMVAIMVAVAVVGKSAASKLGGALSKTFQNLIKKIAPDLLKNTAKNSSKNATQNLIGEGVQRLDDNAMVKEMISNTLNKVVVGGQVTQSGTQAGGSVVQGIFLKNASDALADFTLAQAEMTQIQLWLKQAVEAFASTQKITQQLMVSMSTAQQQSDEAGRFVLRHSRA